ncbi:MAG TPA: sporulation transcriptional regulator SpoIIID [Defluviitaleaceae bacterium]|nr:sporulation transcriptional regulator SpoIIID [Defluviitaleaceae bacterium]
MGRSTGNKIREEIAVECGNYIIENKATVRETAKYIGLGKSTVHLYVTKVLQKTNKALAEEVRKVLDYNTEQRHIRGGIATAKKYLELGRRRIEDDSR